MSRRRWGGAVALVTAEFLVLSVLVDLPTAGPALRVASAVRLLLPAIIGAIAAGFLLAPASRAPALELPAPRRPRLAMTGNLALFATTAIAAQVFLGDRRGTTATADLVLVAAGGAATAALALATVAPLGWIVRSALARWGSPILALALGVLAWRAATAAEALWGVLSTGTLRAVATLLRAAGADVWVDPATVEIGVGDFAVQIAPVCSGVDGLGLVVVFQAIWIALARERLRPLRALVLLPLGVAAALGSNVLRIAALLVIGAAGAPALALGGFHSRLGWLGFLAIAFASVAVADRVAWLHRESAADPGAAPAIPDAAAPHLLPFLAVLGGALVAGLWSGAEPDLWYGARVAAGVGALLAVRRSLPRLELSRSSIPLLVGLATGGAWIAALPAGGAALASSVAAADPAVRFAWIGLRVAGSCLVIPIVEELAFRGFLLPWIAAQELDRFSHRPVPWAAVILSSLVFGLVHQNWIAGTLAGVAFAGVRLYRNRLGDAVLAHAACNAAIAVAAVAWGRWGLWS